jgi:hypothetical protein
MRARSMNTTIRRSCAERGEQTAVIRMLLQQAHSEGAGSIEPTQREDSRAKKRESEHSTFSRVSFECRFLPPAAAWSGDWMKFLTH